MRFIIAVSSLWKGDNTVIDTAKKIGIEGEYVDTATLAKLAGVPRETIGLDIRLGILSAEKRLDGRGMRWGGCWFIRTRDAQKYIDMRKGVSQGISVRELGRRTGQSRQKIADAIQ